MKWFVGAFWALLVAIPTLAHGVTLTVSPTSVAAGGIVTATWASIPSPTATDWLGLYTPGASNTAFLAWRYTTGTASGNGPLTIPPTITPGTYELRLLSNNGFTHLATSNTFTVTGVTLTVSPTSVAAGGIVTATWASIPSPTATDWLGLYTPGASNTAFLAWRYTTGTASGNGPLTIPPTITPGTYELRLLSNNGFTHLATSNTFTVTGVTLTVSPTSVAAGGIVTATWASIPSPTATDWLGLYTPGASNTAFLAWRYTTGTASGNGPLTIPPTITPGTYELRLLSNNGFTHLATSNTFTVQNPVLTGTPLQVSMVNLRYFEDPMGNIVYLAGAYDWDFAAYMSDAMFTEYINYAAAHNMNLLRAPSNDPYIFAPAPAGSAPPIDAYFNKLRDRIIEAQALGIYVIVVIFPWFVEPWNDLNYDKAYARRMVQEVGMLENVLYDIGNEMDTTTMDGGVLGSFMTAIVNEIRAEEVLQGFNPHPVGISDFQGHGDYGQHTDIQTFMLNSVADFIVPGFSFVDGHGSAPSNIVSDLQGQKVSIIDSDHLFPYHYDHHWVWKAFTLGHNVILLDGNQFYADHVVPDDPGDTVGAALTYDARLRIGDTRLYAARLNMAEFTPNPSLSSTGYAAETSMKYLVYQPNSGAFIVTLPLGGFLVEWYDPSLQQVTLGVSVEGTGAPQTFTPPFTGDAVLLLSRFP